MEDINKRVEMYAQMLIDFVGSDKDEIVTKSLGQENGIKEFFNYLRDKKDFIDCLEEYFS